MNDKYFGERVRESQLGSFGLELTNSQYRLISQEKDYLQKMNIINVE